jgi:hypothetical protein
VYGVRGASIAARSPVRGLVFAGSATHGAGFEAVTISGASAAEALLPGVLARGTACKARAEWGEGVREAAWRLPGGERWRTSWGG